MCMAFLEKCLPFDGWYIDKTEYHNDEVTLTHRMLASTSIGKCQECGGRLIRRGTSEATLCDLPLGIFKTKIKLKQPKVQCKHCSNTAIIRPEEVHYTCAWTWRAMMHITKLMNDMPADKVARLLGISTTSAQRANCAMLDFVDRTRPVSLSGRKRIIIDEKHIGKLGFATVVIDDKGEILYLAAGKNKDSLSPFLPK